MFSYCKYADDQLIGHMFLWVNPYISVIATCFWCFGTICLSIDLGVHFRGNPQVWDVENQSVLVATRSDCERLVCLVFTVSFWVNDGCTDVPTITNHSASIIAHDQAIMGCIPKNLMNKNCRKPYVWFGASIWNTLYPHGFSLRPAPRDWKGST